MQPSAVAQARLNRVAKGMAEIQNRANPAFLLILPHHIGLDLATALNRMRQQLGIAREQAVNIRLNPIKNCLKSLQIDACAFESTLHVEPLTHKAMWTVKWHTPSPIVHLGTVAGILW